MVSLLTVTVAVSLSVFFPGNGAAQYVWKGGRLEGRRLDPTRPELKPGNNWGQRWLNGRPGSKFKRGGISSSWGFSGRNRVGWKPPIVDPNQLPAFWATPIKRPRLSARSDKLPAMATAGSIFGGKMESRPISKSSTEANGASHQHLLSKGGWESPHGGGLWGARAPGISTGNIHVVDSPSNTGNFGEWQQTSDLKPPRRASSNWNQNRKIKYDHVG